LLIETLLDGCFRVPEALGIRPRDDLAQSDAGWTVRIMGKGGKPEEVAISASLASRLQSYAYRQALSSEERIFPINPARVWQIIDRAFTLSRIRKPNHVGTVHVLRHSGALARLAATANPKAVQGQLRHVNAKMPLRYLKTLRSMEPLRIQQRFDFGW
jgi:integrase